MWYQLILFGLLSAWEILGKMWIKMCCKLQPERQDSRTLVAHNCKTFYSHWSETARIANFLVVDLMNNFILLVVAYSWWLKIYIQIFVHTSKTCIFGCLMKESFHCNFLLLSNISVKQTSMCIRVIHLPYQRCN